MSVRGSAISREERQRLARQAIRAAADVRVKAGFDLASPICIYDVCEALGITVRFNDINMEGMYQRGRRPRIHLSALRPMPRRAYNCAHELGHHVFGHGTSVDELKEHGDLSLWADPKEVLAEIFAGACLMPLLGLRRSFAVRGWTVSTATSEQLLTVACEFGVGYRTIVTHLAGMKLLSAARATVLRKRSRSSIESEILGAAASQSLAIADEFRANGVCDAEVGMLILVPRDCEVEGSAVQIEADLPQGRVLRAVRTGLVRATVAGTDWAIFVRVCKQNYVGLARYRHLEEQSDE